MRQVGTLAFTVTSLCLVLSACLSAASKSQEEWKPLFNGRDLSGWQIVIKGQKPGQDPDKLFQVHDGEIHGYKDAPAGSQQPYGFICTDREFSHYRLRFEYRWGEKKFKPRLNLPRDGGMLWHVVSPESVHGVWPRCVECQVQENDTGDLITVETACQTWLNPNEKVEKKQNPTYCEPEKGGVERENKWYINANKTCDRLTGWNTVEVVVRGADEAQYIVNGEVNQRLTKIRRPEGEGWVPLGKGRIAFQLEGAEIFYRNIEILELPPR
jgi:hypothetical protein